MYSLWNRGRNKQHALYLKTLLGKFNKKKIWGFVIRLICEIVQFFMWQGEVFKNVKSAVS